MRGLKRKLCEVMPCQHTPFFRPTLQRSLADDVFFRSRASAVKEREGEPVLQRQENTEEKKDPLTEGLKTAGEKLAEQQAFKNWYEPKLAHLKLELWDQASTQDKAAMLAFLGLNLGTAATAFALNPQLRQSLSDVNVGMPLGWIPYSPIEGFKYRLPEPGKSAYGFSADFTFNAYLEALRKAHPGMPLTGATFGLDSTYDPAGGGFALTGGKFGLDFFGGALRAEGKTFNETSAYPWLFPGREPGMPGSWLMQEVPGLPPLRRDPGFQFTLNADLLKLWPGLQSYW
jgi:hypothetical protein